MHIHPTKYLFLTTAAALVLASPAMALDENAFAEKLAAAFTQQGNTITYDGVEVDGDDVILHGMKISTKAPQVITLPVGDVTFEDVEESDAEFSVGHTQFPDVDAVKDGVHITVKNIEISGLSVPKEATDANFQGMPIYESASTGEIAIEKDGKTIVSIGSTAGKMDRAGDNSSVTFKATVADIAADLTAIPSKDPKAAAVIDALQLQQLQGEVNMTGSWEVATGKVDLSEYSMDLRDVGKLNIKLNFSGYTMEFLKAMREAQEAMAKNPDQKAAQSSFGLAMMGLMQQLTFNSAAVRFDDASITKRVLDFAGQQQGVNGEQFAQSLKAMAPIMLARLNMPEFQAQLTTALNAYLDNPESIEIVAAPSSPVPVPQIMGAVMGAPQTIPQVLGVSVNANN